MLKLLLVAVAAAGTDDDEGGGGGGGGGCGDPALGPVLKGVDMVDLYENSAPTYSPKIGLPQHNDTRLGGYEFRFVSADNLAKFRANATKYAPALGGF